VARRTHRTRIKRSAASNNVKNWTTGWALNQGKRSSVYRNASPAGSVQCAERHRSCFMSPSTRQRSVAPASCVRLSQVHLSWSPQSLDSGSSAAMTTGEHNTSAPLSGEASGLKKCAARFTRVRFISARIQGSIRQKSALLEKVRCMLLRPLSTPLPPCDLGSTTCYRDGLLLRSCSRSGGCCACL
jgi:hypothetical protein